MSRKYDIAFITTIPAFYKVRLFNEIARNRSIIVFYSGSNTALRSRDFLTEASQFKSVLLDSNPVVACWQVFSFFRKNNTRRLIVSGWDTIVSFFAVFLHNKRHNGCIVESSIYESEVNGVKAFFKRVLLKRVSTVYVSGKAQRRLIESLHFSGDVVEYGGCGLLNYVTQPKYSPRESVKSFLFVGQLIEKKGVAKLITVFNRNPQWQLTVIGDGILRNELEGIATDNIQFLGTINNSELSKYYQEADVFILPSLIEPWGLVVEEALNNGTPVIVSDRVGCADSLVLPNNVGFVFDSANEESMEDCIERICDVDQYNLLRKNVSYLNFFERAKHQVDAFL